MNLSEKHYDRYFGLVIPDRKYEFDGNGNLTYEGIYPRGSASSDNVWIIERYFYTNGQPTDSMIRFGISWDSRGTIS